MAQPASSVTKYVRRLTAAGVAATGKVLADFTITAYHKPNGGAAATFTHGSTITELASGYYAWTYNLPSTAGMYGLDIVAAAGTDTVDLVPLNDELENADLDAIAASVNRPIVGLSGSGTIGQVTPITDMVNKRYRELSWSFVDENGAAVDMTTYTNITFGVRSKTDMTTTPPKVDAVNGTTTPASAYVVTAGSGLITVKVPEDATFFTLTEGASPADSLELAYELTGDVGGNVLKTVSLVSNSPLTLIRRDVGT
jgi:hypothetical protein